MKADLPSKHFATQESFRVWLDTHQTSPGLWVRFAKKGTGVESITYDQAVEVALCYGWIDGQLKSLDQTYYQIRFVPRQSKSVWSLRNRTKVEQLTAAGKMQPAGLAAIEAAKANGYWEAAYSSSSNMADDPAFTAALNKDAKAKAFYATLNRADTYAIQWRIHTTKPEKRQAKIGQMIAMLHDSKKFH